MDWNILWGGLGGALAVGIPLLIAGYAKVKEANAKAAVEAAAVQKLHIENQRLQDEVSAKKRRDDADFDALESERITKQWETFNAEMKEHYESALSSVQAELNAMKAEIDKRREEHHKCQIENAVIRQQIEEMKARLARLEKGQP